MCMDGRLYSTNLMVGIEEGDSGGSMASCSLRLGSLLSLTAIWEVSREAVRSITHPSMHYDSRPLQNTTS